LWVVRLAMGAPLVGDLLFWSVHKTLPLFEKAKMRMKWQYLFNLTRGYAYWRGVRDVFGSWKAMRSYQSGTRQPPEISLDILDGLPEKLDEVWVEGPSQIKIYYSGRLLGILEIENEIEEPLHERLAEELLVKLRLPLAINFFTQQTSLK
jgi:hypothetical protein